MVASSSKKLPTGYIETIYQAIAGGKRLDPTEVYHRFMSLGGRSFDPGRPPRLAGPTVDYTLARRSTILSLRRGALGTNEICDAHPELMRAARNIGEEVRGRCPVCSHEALRWVRYVYGDELRHLNGRVVYPQGWLDELVRQHDQFTCYVVEVCLDCAWNHLLRSFLTGRKWASRRPVPAEARSGALLQREDGTD
jgi:hypothetical protein